MSVVVMSVGGSLINPGEINIAFLERLKAFVVSRPEKFIIITGGGAPARQYSKAAKELGLSPLSWDFVGIAATMLNGELVRQLFGVSSKVLQRPRKVELRKVLVGCGWKPGCSSDYEAVLWAKLYSVKLIVNLSNTDYVFTKDPKKFPDAVPLKHVSWSNYEKMITSEWTAGLNTPFDPIATRVAHRAKLKVAVINGQKLEELGKCLDDRDFIGTVLSNED